MAEQIKRRARLRSIVAAVVSVLFVFAAVVVGALFLPGSGGGTVRVHVQSTSGDDLPLADIYLDGKKVCEATPCVLRHVEPGARKLRVVAPGHAPHDQPVAVDEGQDRLLAVTVERHGG
jgi:hypothetical protein